MVIIRIGVKEKGERWNLNMLDFSWKVFSLTGDIETFLILKELERESEGKNEQDENFDANDSFNATIH